MYQAPPEYQSSAELIRSYQALNDETLMGLISGGNQAAFNELVTRHTTTSLKLANRTLSSLADAEDVVQTVFIKIWQRPDAWVPSKSAFTTWLYRVVINACYDQQRSRSRRDGPGLDQVAEPASPDLVEEHIEQTQAQEQQRLIQQALKNLPPNQRDAINLAVYLALPQKQVAAIMGVSLKAVESLLIRAKKQLKELIHDQKSSDGFNPNEGK